MESNRVIGYGLIGGAAIVGLIGVAWGFANLASGAMEVTGFLFCLLPLLLLVAMLAGGGIYVLRRTSGELTEQAEVKRQRQILSAVQTKGQLSLAEAALEAGATLDQTRQDVYDLVGKGLFSGYIDWKQGVLYSRQARDLRASGLCPNCGGKLELAGKGVVKCPYCDSEIFL